MHREIDVCGHCGTNIHGDRWKLTMYSQTKPYSWRSINWNKYYCRECAAKVMERIEEEDANG